MILGPIALFSNYNITSSSGKHLEDINHALIVGFLYNFLTSTRGCDDLSIGFDRSRDRRKQELKKNKDIKGTHFEKMFLASQNTN